MKDDCARFLIIDDDESIHLYLEGILSAFAECDCASSGEQGMELFDTAIAEGKPYDAVFMDILMPGITGHEAAAVMRTSEKHRGVREREQFKLVMITSLVDDANVSRAFFESHASCYITKPLIKDVVLDELRQNLII